MFLKINSLLIKRGKKILIDDFNLTIRKSQIFIISGDNGIGKSTLIETIVGLQNNYEGKITLFPYEKFKNKLSINNIFYMGHLNALKDELSILENLKIWNRINFLPYREEDLIKKLTYFGLQNLFDIKINRLSFGQKRKVSLTKLLLTNSKLWILDEPCNGLDFDSEKKFIEMIVMHQKKKGSVVFTSHKKYNLNSVRSIDLNKFRPTKKLKKNSNAWGNL